MQEDTTNSSVEVVPFRFDGNAENGHKTGKYETRE